MIHDLYTRLPLPTPLAFPHTVALCGRRKKKYAHRPCSNVYCSERSSSGLDQARVLRAHRTFREEKRGAVRPGPVSYPRSACQSNREPRIPAPDTTMKRRGLFYVCLSAVCPVAGSSLRLFRPRGLDRSPNNPTHSLTQQGNIPTPFFSSSVQLVIGGSIIPITLDRYRVEIILTSAARPAHVRVPHSFLFIYFSAL